MKNRKIVVVAFLLVAVLLLGVGYAALTDTLEINGSADVDRSGAESSFNDDIVFDSATAIGGDPNTASISQTDFDMADFGVNSLKGAGDKAQFKFVIANNGDVDANVTPTLASDGNTNDEFFDIESDWKGETRLLKAGEKAEYTLTVTLKKTPTDTIHGSFHIELSAVSVG